MNRRGIFWAGVCFGFFLSISTNAIGNDEPLFGPAVFHRSQATPASEQRTFSVCNPNAEYLLTIKNGPDNAPRASSVRVFLNDFQIVGPMEFNQQIGVVKKAVQLEEENVLDVEIRGTPSAALEIQINCLSGCPDLEITKPVEGSLVGKSEAMIFGEVQNAPGEIGIVLWAETDEGAYAAAFASVFGDSFVGKIPLENGQSTVSAIATDSCGVQIKKDVILYSDSQEEEISIEALPESGILNPTTGTFTTMLSANTFLPSPITAFNWDVDGDGKFEQSGPALKSISMSYDQPGFYFPEVEILTEDGAAHSAETVVTVFPSNRMEALLRAKWEGMKTAVAINNIPKALSYFSSSSKPLYQELFVALAEQMPQIAEGFGEIKLVSLKDRVAKFLIIRDEEWNGQEYPIAYEIFFVQDENGIWKIERF